MSYLFLVISLVTSYSTISENVSPEWKARMQELRSSLDSILPILANPEGLKSPIDREKALKGIDRLSSASHSLKETQERKLDPADRWVADHLESEFKRARAALTLGNTRYARSLLMGATQYCVSCHTQGGQEKQASFSLNSVALDKLEPLDRGRFLTAVRDFKGALGVYRSVLLSDKALQSPLRWEEALRLALAVTVRVEESSEATLKLINEASKQGESRPGGLPLFLSREIQAWKKSLESWRVIDDSISGHELLMEGQKLLKRAEGVQEFHTDRAGDVDLLRATRVLHESLRRSTSSSHRAQAMLYLGQAYERLQDLDLWTLHEAYYESCVRELPHSLFALKCYRQLESSIYAGFSGSGGTEIPNEVMTHLADVRKLAEPKRTAPIED